MVCKNCGNQIEFGDAFCGVCGTKVDFENGTYTQMQPQPQASYTMANFQETPQGAEAPVQVVAEASASAPKKKTGLIIGAVVVAVVLIAVIVTTVIPKIKQPNVDNSNPAVEQDAGFNAGAEKTVGMPDCVGWTIDSVDEFFESIDCTINYEYEFDSEVAEDCIISQDVSAGEELKPGAKINFVVSKGEDLCPEEYKQKIVVTGSAGSTTAYMQLFIWENGEWKNQYSCNATVGRNGIGSNYGEGKGVTPAGDFELGVVLTENAISNQGWPYKIVTEDTCVVDDVSSPYYNTIVSSHILPGYVSYDPIGDTIINADTDKCMYIEHNGNGTDSYDVVAGNGSAITICGKTSDLHSTAGCVDISSKDFNAILNLLDYDLTPHIIIGVE